MDEHINTVFDAKQH